MFLIDFLSKPVNAELCAMIIASPLADGEKRDWLSLLPVMNEDEKEKLKINLQAEIKDFADLEKRNLQMLEEKINILMTGAHE